MNPNQSPGQSQGKAGIGGFLSPYSSVPWHLHTGAGGDAPRISFSSIFQKRFWITQTLPGTTAQTDGNYDVFWVAPFRGYVNRVQEVHSVAGTDAGAVTLTVEILTGTAASGAGQSVLTTVINLKGTANTVVDTFVNSPAIVLDTTRSHLNFSAGDRIGLKAAGTKTTLANVVVTIEVVFN